METVIDPCYIFSVNIQLIRLIHNSFRGTLALFPDMMICYRDSLSIYCENPNALTDGMVGPEQPDLFMDNPIDRLKYVVWTKENEQPYLSIEPTNNSATISTIDLYMYNYPAMGFGLPNLELYGTSSVTVLNNPPPESALEFDLINNDKLSQDDINRLRRVTLRLRMLTTVKALLLRWNFAGLLNFKFFGLSEFVLCEEDSLPEYDNTQSIPFLAPKMNFTVTLPKIDKSLILNCTVSIQGSFEWQWKNGSINIVQSSTTSLFTADGTRTSILRINEPKFTDVGTYMCEARFSGMNETYSRLFDIQLPSKLLQ